MEELPQTIPSKTELLMRAEKLCYAERMALAGQIGKTHQGSEAVASLIKELTCASIQPSPAVGIKSLSGNSSSLLTGSGETTVAENYMCHHLGLVMASSYRQSLPSRRSQLTMAAPPSSLAPGESSSISSSPNVGIGEEVLERQWNCRSLLFKDLAAKEVVRQTVDDELLLEKLTQASAKMCRKLVNACARQRRVAVLESYCDKLREAGNDAEVVRILHSCSSGYVREHLPAGDWTERMAKFHGEFLLDLLRDKLLATAGDKNAQREVWSSWVSKIQSLHSLLSAGDSRQRCKKFAEVLIEFSPSENTRMDQVFQCLKMLFAQSEKEMEVFLTKYGPKNIDGWDVRCISETDWHASGLIRRRFDLYIDQLRRSAEMTTAATFWLHIRPQGDWRENEFSNWYQLFSGHLKAFNPLSIQLNGLTSNQMNEVVWVVRQFMESIKPSKENWEKWSKGASDMAPGRLSVAPMWESDVFFFHDFLRETLLELFEWPMHEKKRCDWPTRSVVKTWQAMEKVWVSHWDFLMDGMFADGSMRLCQNPRWSVLASDRLWNMVVRFSPQRIGMFFDRLETFLDQRWAHARELHINADPVISQVYEGFCSAWLNWYPTRDCWHPATRYCWHPAQCYNDDDKNTLPTDLQAETQAVCDRIVSHWWQHHMMPGLAKGQWNVKSEKVVVKLFALGSPDVRSELIGKAFLGGSIVEESPFRSSHSSLPLEVTGKHTTWNETCHEDVIPLLESLLCTDPRPAKEIDYDSSLSGTDTDYLYTKQWPLLLRLVCLLPNQARGRVATMLRESQQVQSQFLRYVMSITDLTKLKEQDEMIKQCSLPSPSERQEVAAALYAASLRTATHIELERTIQLLVQKVRSAVSEEQDSYFDVLFSHRDKYLELCISSNSWFMSGSSEEQVLPGMNTCQDEQRFVQSGQQTAVKSLGNRDFAEGQKTLWLQLLQDVCASSQARWAPSRMDSCSDFAEDVLTRVAQSWKGSESQSEVCLPYPAPACSWWDLGVEMQWRIHVQKLGSGELARSSFIIALDWPSFDWVSRSHENYATWEAREMWVQRCRQLCDALYFSYERLFHSTGGNRVGVVGCQQLDAMVDACGALWTEVPRLVGVLKEKLALLHCGHGGMEEGTGEVKEIRELFKKLLDNHSRGPGASMQKPRRKRQGGRQAKTRRPLHRSRQPWYAVSVLREFVNGELQERTAGRAFDVVFMWYVDRVLGSQRNGLSKVAAKREAVTWLISECASAIHLRFVQQFMLHYAQDMLTPFLQGKELFEGRFYIDPWDEPEYGEPQRLASERSVDGNVMNKQFIIKATSNLHRLSTAQCNMLLEQLGHECADVCVPLSRRSQCAQRITYLPVFSPSCLMSVLARWGGAELDAEAATLQTDTSSHYLSDESDYVMCPSDISELSESIKEMDLEMPTVDRVTAESEASLASPHFVDYAPSLPAAVLLELFKGLKRVHEPLASLPLAAAEPVVAAFPVEVSLPLIWICMPLYPMDAIWKTIDQLATVACKNRMRMVTIMKDIVRLAICSLQQPVLTAGGHDEQAIRLRSLSLLKRLWYGKVTHCDVLFVILREVAGLAVQPNTSPEVLKVVWGILRSSLTRCRSKREVLAALMLGIPEPFLKSALHRTYTKEDFRRLGTQVNAFCDFLSTKKEFSIPTEMCRQYFETAIAPICEHSRISAEERGLNKAPSPFDWVIHAYAVTSLGMWADVILHDLGIEPQVTQLAKQVALDLSIAFVLHPNIEFRKMNWFMQCCCIGVLQQGGGLTSRRPPIENHTASTASVSRSPDNQHLKEALSVYLSLFQSDGNSHDDHHRHALLEAWSLEWHGFAPSSPLPLWIQRVMKEHMVNLSFVLINTHHEQILEYGTRVDDWTIAHWEALCGVALVAERLAGEQLFLQEIWSIRITSLVRAVLGAIKSDNSLEGLDLLKEKMTECLLIHERLGCPMSGKQVVEFLYGAHCDVDLFYEENMSTLLQWAVVDAILGCDLPLGFMGRCNRLQLCLQFLTMNLNTHGLMLVPDALRNDLTSRIKTGKHRILKVIADLLHSCAEDSAGEQQGLAVADSHERQVTTVAVADLMERWELVKGCLQLLANQYNLFFPGKDDIALGNVVDGIVTLLQQWRGRTQLKGSVVAIIKILIAILEKASLHASTVNVPAVLSVWLSKFMGTWKSAEQVTMECSNSEADGSNGVLDLCELIVMNLIADAPDLVASILTNASEFSLLGLCAVRAACCGTREDIDFEQVTSCGTDATEACGTDATESCGTDATEGVVDLYSAWCKKPMMIPSSSEFSSKPADDPRLGTVSGRIQEIQESFLVLMSQVETDVHLLLKSVDVSDRHFAVTHGVDRSQTTVSLRKRSRGETGEDKERQPQTIGERRQLVMRTQEKYWKTALHILAKHTQYLFTPSTAKRTIQFTKKALAMQACFPLKDWQRAGCSKWTELNVVVSALDILESVYASDKKDGDDDAKLSLKNGTLEALAAFIGPFGGNGDARRVTFEDSEETVVDDPYGSLTEDHAVNFRQLCLYVGFQLLKSTGPHYLHRQTWSIGDQRSGMERDTNSSWSGRGTFQVWEPEFVAALDAISLQKIDLKLVAETHSLRVVDTWALFRGGIPDIVSQS